MKLQWRYMVSDVDDATANEANRPRKYYLPPLSLKATLNQPPEMAPPPATTTERLNNKT